MAGISYFLAGLFIVNILIYFLFENFISLLVIKSFHGKLSEFNLFFYDFN